jgi:DNA-3-methyladenine glycosylase II
MSGDPRSGGGITHDLAVRGPWSLATSRRFWEGFAPQRLAAHEGPLTTVFRADRTWEALRAQVVQDGATARITIGRTDGGAPSDPDAAIAQVARFLSLDVDATPWPGVGERDAVIGALQSELPGLRPCGFHSPYEAAAWAVLSQRIRITQAASLRERLTADLGEDGAFPAPDALLEADPDLPGRKAEYLRAVARAALEGTLDGAHLRALDPADALEEVQGILGLGPFAAELVVIRGANAPDALPRNERRLAQEITERYGEDADPAAVSEGWRPLRTWASVLLRIAREERTGEIEGRRPGGRPGRR